MFHVVMPLLGRPSKKKRTWGRGPLHVLCIDGKDGREIQEKHRVEETTSTAVYGGVVQPAVHSHRSGRDLADHAQGLKLKR